MTYNYTVDLTSWFFMAFIIGTSLNSCSTAILNWFNSKTAMNWKETLKSIHSSDKEMKKAFPTSKIRKAFEYDTETDATNDAMNCLKSPISMLFLLFGVIPFSINTLLNIYPSNFNPAWSYITFAIMGFIVSTLFNIPFSLHSTFITEQRFGFNKMTRKMFYSDILKSIPISLVFITCSTILLNYVLTSFGRYSITEIFCFVLGLTVLGFLMEQLYFNVIMKLFNKFEPLKNQKLSRKIKNLAKKCGYNNIKVLVMDESKRSNHSNAFVCGFGKNHKKIILFDTLLKNYTDEEILSIIGHELGHAKLHHLETSRFLNLISISVKMLLIFSLIYNTDFYHAFGYNWITEENVLHYSYLGFILSSMFLGAFSWILEPFDSSLSRKHEYEADRFSANLLKTNKHGISSLLKITNENLSFPFVHPMFEMWTYGHPSILNRIKALRNLNLSKRKSLTDNK